MENWGQKTLTSEFIQCIPSVLIVLLQWLGNAKVAAPEMTQVWDTMAAMKKTLYDMLDSENDG